jgi:hypothetical protein
VEQALGETRIYILSILLLAGLIVAREVGLWLRRPRDRNIPDDSGHGYVVSGVMGLLALLVAFTFGLALERYQTRRDLVVAEANAIGTAEMRVRLLDPPHAARLSALYHDYAEVRLRYGLAGASDKPPLLRRSEALRGRIQAAALAGVRPIRTTALAALVVPAVNETLDIGAAREAAHAAQLPATVFVVLVVYALLAAAVLGAAVGRAARPDRTMTTLLFVLLTLAMSLTLDLDRPQAGSIRVSQAPMARLVASLRATPLPSAESAPPSPATPASPVAGGSSRP